MKKSFGSIPAAAGLAALFSLSSFTFAAAAPRGGSGGGHPGGMPAGVPPISHPVNPEAVGRPSAPPNPNGSPPIGKATNAPDTDRGRSEGKGRTDRTRRTVGTVVSFSGTTLTLKLPTGVTKTFTVDAHAFGQLKPGTAVVVTMRGNSSRALSVVRQIKR